MRIKTTSTQSLISFLLLLSLSVLLTACGSKQDEPDYSSMTDEEVIRMQQKKAQSSQQHLSGNPSREEIKEFYAEQARKAKEHEEKLYKRLMEEDKARVRAEELEKLAERQGAMSLTKANVRSFLASFEQVVMRQKNASKMSSFISNDAVITITSPSLPNAMTMSKNEYIQLTASSMRSVKNYKYNLNY